MFAIQILSIFRFFYLLGAVNALFFSLLIFAKKNRSIADKILGGWLVILCVQLIIPFLYLSDINTYYKYAGFEIILFIFHPVLLYFYVKATIGQLPALKKILICLIPILIAELVGLMFFLYPAEERLRFIKGEIMLPLVYLPFMAFMMAYFFYYLYKAYKTLKNYKNTILHIYSYRENVDLFWLRKLVILFGGIILLVFPMGLISYFFFYFSIFADFLFYLLLVLFVFLLGFWGYQQGQVFNFNNGQNLNVTSNRTENYIPEKMQENSTVIQKQYKKEALELDFFMKSKKPYLESNLTIHDLSKLLNHPPYLLSKIINKEFHCNFFEFINKYRITEFKEKVIAGQYKNLTILALALECGFNSKSAFNRIFKDYTGITPGDFIKQQPS